MALARVQAAFGTIVLAQAAHSAEEYYGRLWESFPPARFLTGLVATDLERGFLVLNVPLLAFGAWCFLLPSLRRWPSSELLAWVWVTIETVNGIGHPVWSILQGGYTPGVATAPLLLALAIWLARELLRERGLRR
jgi:hypothetical protein